MRCRIRCGVTPGPSSGCVPPLLCAPVSQNGDLLTRAVQWAARAHAHQFRKVSGAPYLAHLLGVTGTVASLTNDEVTLAAAVLHDIIEDQRATFEQAVMELDDPRMEAVWQVVQACTDVVDRTQVRDWRERKGLYIAKLEALGAHPDSDFVRRVLTVSLADKLYNARAIEYELRNEGLPAFTRMAGQGLAATWYLPEVARALSALSAQVGDRALRAHAREYQETVERIRRSYEYLPSIDPGQPIGPELDVAIGISSMRYTERDGRTVLLDVQLQGDRHGSVSVFSRSLGPSQAAKEPEFVDAISAAARQVIVQTFLRARSGVTTLGRAFSVAALALEHGASTVESCAAMLYELPRRARGATVLAPRVVDALGPEVGPRVFETMVAATYLSPHGSQAPHRRRKPMRIDEPESPETLRSSAMRVLAASELERFRSIEVQLRNSSLTSALPYSYGERLDVSRFVNECVASLQFRRSASLAAALVEAGARVESYFELAFKLRRRQLEAAPEAIGTELILRDVYGRRLRAEIQAVRPAPEVGTQLR